MASKSYSFCTSNDLDTAFIDGLKIRERREGRANFSWVVIQALKEYDSRRKAERELLEQTKGAN